MRFFSNDARESSDDQVPDDQARDEQARDSQGRDERPDRVQSDPVAVPNQRPGSPWSNTPPAAADDTTRVDTAGADPDVAAGRADTEPPPFHEPGAQPTAFGASTVGGAVAASATANPENDRWDATDRVTAADSGVGDDAAVAPGDGVVTSSADPDGRTAGTAPDTVPATWTEQERDARDRTDPDDIVDVPLDDQTRTEAGAVSARSGALDTDGVSTDADRDTNRDESVTTYEDADSTKDGALKDDGGFDDPEAVDPVTERPLISGVDDDTPREQDADADAATTKDTDAATDAGPLTDEGGFDDPKVVDPATGTPLDADRTTEDHPAESAAPVVASVPAAAVAAAAGPSPDKLFDQDDARGFQERWRDVQLRFVDGPKDAAGDAAKLVDEAVERLTARLRAQREGLHRDTEDTEQLRVQLRGYRDILNRILGL